MSITNGIVSSKIYDKQDDFNFDFEIVNFPFLMEMFLALLPMVYIFIYIDISDLPFVQNKDYQY